GRADPMVRPLPGRFAESVVLADANASPSYSVELVVPAGVSAAQAGSDVDLRDAASEVVGRFGGGIAFDASVAKAGALATAPVGVRLANQQAGVVTVEVAISTPAWLTAAGRPSA
ncbi:MAG: hypothetical protein M3179_08680, partial [Actinomycetota bacterium]|nr:hypothetical protein [Actinomycetota bacterium]